MLLMSLAALMIQAAPVTEAPARDTAVGVFDSPATEELVERTIRESGSVPDGLEDYRATVRTGVYLTLAPDSSLGGELPVTADEMMGEVRWRRSGHLHQRVQQHRTRLLVPVPYTLGTILETPWVIPHLYGSTIAVLSPTAADVQQRSGPRRAIHPFGVDGPRYYRYPAGDTVRIRTQDEIITLVPIEVRPRATAPRGGPALVVGSFSIDTARAAVARARFGFVGAGRGLAAGQAGTFLELENGLWEGRYWLPRWQRREVQAGSSLLGGAVAGRVVNQFTDYALNTGWIPEGSARVRLFRDATTASGVPADWDAADGADPAEWDVADFADLRRLASGAGGDPDAVRVALHYERGDHLFRYNRVEGAYAGIGVRIAPAEPLRAPWDVYATAGWAFAESAPRGELRARWQWRDPLPLLPGVRWGAQGGVYRRLHEVRAFDPALRWDYGYTLSAVFGGSDLRDYYDASGVEAALSARTGSWTARFGGRWEQQDSVQRNTGQFLFGTAEEFPPLAPVDPGTHAALEAEIGYVRGSGATSIGNSTVGSLRGEAGVGDFGFGRATALLSLRRSAGPLTLAGRMDAGHAWGDVPVQKLFRFGSAEGLRGYEPNEFGGSSAAVVRGRLLIGLPPRGLEPLARSGVFIVPPLRPSLVLLGEAGWSDVTERSRPQLARLGSAPTGDIRGSLGAGISIFNDFLTVEWVRPLEPGRSGRWYAGLVAWF